jgi:Spy/CpxP family protein refolding chaperone
LDGLIHAQAIDEAAIRAQVGKISAIRVDFALQRAHYLHDMRAVLTKEQIQRFQQVGSEATEARLDNFLTRIGGTRAAAPRPAVAPAK